MAPSQIHKPFIFLQTINAALGLVFWMYTSLVFNSVQIYLQKYVFPHASTTVFSLIASAPQMGGIPGSLLAGPLAQKIGRRSILILVDVISIVGVILTVFGSLPALIIGRFIQGVVIGAELVMVPMYVSEMSPIEMTGQTGALYMLMSSLGTQLGFGVGFLMPSTPEDGKPYMWRLLFAAAAIPNLVRLALLLIIFRRETPFYLAIKNKEQDTVKILSKMFSKERVPLELERLQEEKAFISSNSKRGNVGIKDLFKKKYRKCLMIGIFISLSWSFAGMNTIFVFSNVMLLDTVNDPKSKIPVLFSTLFGEIDFLACLLAYFLSKKLKRKTAFLTGSITVGIINLAYGIIGLIDPKSPMLKFILLLWPIFFEFSFGFTVATYLSETLPEIGLSVTMVTNNITAFLITQFYLNLAEKIGHSGVMLGMGICCFASFFIIKAFMIETKYKSKAEILSEYSGIRLEKVKSLGSPLSQNNLLDSPEQSPEASPDKLRTEEFDFKISLQQVNTENILVLYDQEGNNEAENVPEEIAVGEMIQTIKTIQALEDENNDQVMELSSPQSIRRLSKRLSSISTLVADSNVGLPENNKPKATKSILYEKPIVRVPGGLFLSRYRRNEFNI